MANFKIEVDEETCIGCGACAATCDEGFVLKDTDKGSKAKAKRSEVDELGCIEDAANACPVTAIHITNTKTNDKVI
jgi:ferredoxin